MPFLIPQLWSCSCWQRKKSERRVSEEDDSYGVIAPTTKHYETLNSEPKVNYRSGRNGDNGLTHRHSKPASSQTDLAVKNDKRRFISVFRRSHPQRELPQLPSTSKKVTFPPDLPLIDDVVPTYESIDNEEDAESVSDPMYSKVGNGTLPRYDYPSFNAKTAQRRNDESLYVSASQIYSAASEDPYSSIVSENEHRRAVNDDSRSTNEPGYARVEERPPPIILKSSTNNLDALYAKVSALLLPSDTLSGNSSFFSAIQ
jgi:hypothetical protein